MKQSKKIILLITLASSTAIAVTSFAHTTPPKIDYVKLLKEDIKKGGCYGFAMSGSTIRTDKTDGKGPTRTFSFYGNGDMSAEKSLHSKLKVSFTDRPDGKQDDTTVWFGSRNGFPVGGLIQHSWGDANIDFQRLRLKKMHIGWVLNAESHKGAWNAKSYSMVIHKKSCE